MKILILIPCYNTHSYIDDLISQIKSYTNHDILIYDDGSSPPIKKHTDCENIYFLRNELNSGKGSTLFSGFEYAKDANYTHVITLDGDMQHSPKDINKFISIDSSVEFVFGCRKFRKPMPIHRILSNTITSFIISILVNKKIKDTQCGYRRYKLSTLDITAIDNRGYLYETEILLKSISAKTSFKNLNIETIYSDSVSSINNIKDTFRFIKVIMRHVFA